MSLNLRQKQDKLQGKDEPEDQVEFIEARAKATPIKGTGATTIGGSSYSKDEPEEGEAKASPTKSTGFTSISSGSSSSYPKAKDEPEEGEAKATPTKNTGF